MLRRTLPLALLACMACSTPPIRLSPAYPDGAVRTYRLTAHARTSISVAGVSRLEDTELVARSRLEVLGVAGDESTIRLTLVPLELRRNGARAPLPAEQRAELTIGPDGSVRKITSIGDLPADVAGANADDLAPVIGAPLPSRRLRLGSRWTTPLTAPQGAAATEPGVQRGRVAGLRRVRGYDCAMIDLGTQRPLVRERSVLGQPLRLIGTEFSQSTIAFAFRRGFPVDVRTSAEGRFQVSTGSFTGGSVTIETTTRLELLGAR